MASQIACIALPAIFLLLTPAGRLFRGAFPLGRVRAGLLLVLPLGACFLPAFLLTTVVPVMITLGAQLAA